MRTFIARLFPLACGLSLLVQVSFGYSDDSKALPDKVEFNRDIRPILSDRCFACHGPDKNTREADVRFDTQEGLHGNSDKPGPVIPGNPSESEMIRRIESTEAEIQMPPPAFAKEVSPYERQLLRKWIEQGATFEGHWAFQPIRLTPPSTADGKPVERSVAASIDAYVRAALPQAGLAPSAIADPRTLARRVAFDLTGLPAKADFVERLVQDPSDANYERMVQELIDSPQFGERLAVWWLDLVRYADSVGYHGDQVVSVTPFRDYVVHSFNNNKPFDQFTMEQLAGDLMENATLENQIASGYNRLGMMSAEGGAQSKEYLSKYISERVRNVSGAWLGVTFGCCECHDHKFDPFRAKDFYQLEAFFADIQEKGVYDAGSKIEPWGPDIAVPTMTQKQQVEDLTARMEAIKKLLATPSEQLSQSQRVWESGMEKWTTLRPMDSRSSQGAVLTTLDDGSILVSGNNPDTDEYSLVFQELPAEISAIRIEVLPDSSFPNQGPGRAGNGNFVLTELEAYWLSEGPNQSSTDPTAQAIPIQNAVASYEQTGAADGNPYGKWSVAGAFDRDVKGAKWGWAIMEQAGKPNYAIFELANDATVRKDRKMKLVLKQNLDNPKHTLGRFRISVAKTKQPISLASAVPPEIESILSVSETDRSPGQTETLGAYFRKIAPELQKDRDELARLTTQLTELNQLIPRTLITKRVEPRTIRVLSRGNWMDESGEVVEPAIPTALGKNPESSGRLTRMDLAKWIVSRDNPLTSRVAVNRLWKLFYGSGISRRLDDLGAQGEWPTHLALLDFLALEFMNSGWDVKHIVKQMVISETYKQSSEPSQAARESDPYNKWLSHQSRWRLDAEFVRDNALATSGLLAQAIGHDVGKPYQPKGYWDYLNFPQRQWENGKGDQLYRRGLYTHWQRQYLHPSLLAFDAPGREECIAERTRSNTPLQALVLLNDPIFIEAARAMAYQVLKGSESKDEARIQTLFRDVLCRSASEAEVKILETLLAGGRSEYRADVDSANRFLSIGEFKGNDVDTIELAAWTGVTRVILNLHETITRN